MINPQPISTAPKDGSPVRAGTESKIRPGHFPYGLTVRFENGGWVLQGGDCDGRPYDPQPTHWDPDDIVSKPPSQDKP